jgi:hypothetical protein
MFCSAGFKIFSRETNHNPCVSGKLPTAVEYSLVNEESFFSRSPTFRAVTPQAGAFPNTRQFKHTSGAYSVADAFGRHSTPVSGSAGRSLGALEPTGDFDVSVVEAQSLNVTLGDSSRLLPADLQGAGLGGRLNAAIVILTQAERVPRLKQTLALLDANFNDRFHYPVVIFEDDLSPAHRASIAASSRSEIQFRRVRFSLPPWINATAAKENNVCNAQSASLGYR